MSELLDQLKFIKENLQSLETVETIGYKISEKETLLMSPELKLDYDNLIFKFISELAISVLNATKESKIILGQLLIDHLISFTHFPKKSYILPRGGLYVFSEEITKQFLKLIREKIQNSEDELEIKMSEIREAISQQELYLKSTVEDIINNITKNIRIVTGMPEISESEFVFQRKKPENLDSIDDAALPLLNEVLTHKQEILLLEKLGVFDIDKLSKLTTQKKGILFSKLLIKSAKNTEDLIRDRYLKDPKGKHALYTPANIKKVNEILESVGLEKIVVTTRPTTQSK